MPERGVKRETHPAAAFFCSKQTQPSKRLVHVPQVRFQ